MRILIVDDDPSLRQMLEITFEVDQRVEAVESVGTPDAALEAAERFRPDVIVVDSVLQTDAAEVGPALREVVPDTRLISFSGMDREAEWADATILKSGEGVAALKRVVLGDPAPAPEERSEEEVEFRRFLHDMRNPIGALLGFTTILKTRKDALSPEQLDQVVDSMHRAAERLSKLVDDFATTGRDQSK